MLASHRDPLPRVTMRTPTPIRSTESSQAFVTVIVALVVAILLTLMVVP